MQQGVYFWRAMGVFRDGTIWDGKNVGDSKGVPQYKCGTATLLK
jgi:hypothetical protein